MKKGFTLIELLTVLAIITILTSVSLFSYRSAQKEYLLENSARKLAQDIRRAEEMAISTRQIINPNNPTEKFVPKGGYGIYIKLSPTQIILFADCNDNQSYQSGNVCGTSPNKFSEKIEEIALESNVMISDISPSSPLNIVFKPPNPTVYVNGNQTSASITLSTPGFNQTKTIRINPTGLIYVE